MRFAAHRPPSPCSGGPAAGLPPDQASSMAAGGGRGAEAAATARTDRTAPAQRLIGMTSSQIFFRCRRDTGARRRKSKTWTRRAKAAGAEIGGRVVRPKSPHRPKNDFKRFYPFVIRRRVRFSSTDSTRTGTRERRADTMPDRAAGDCRRRATSSSRNWDFASREDRWRSCATSSTDGYVYEGTGHPSTVFCRRMATWHTGAISQTTKTIARGRPVLELVAGWVRDGLRDGGSGW